MSTNPKSKIETFFLEPKRVITLLLIVVIILSLRATYIYYNATEHISSLCQKELANIDSIFYGVSTKWANGTFSPDNSEDFEQINTLREYNTTLLLTEKDEIIFCNRNIYPTNINILKKLYLGTKFFRFNNQTVAVKRVRSGDKCALIIITLDNVADSLSATRKLNSKLFTNFNGEVCEPDSGDINIKDSRGEPIFAIKGAYDDYSTPFALKFLFVMVIVLLLFATTSHRMEKYKNRAPLKPLIELYIGAVVISLLLHFIKISLNSPILILSILFVLSDSIYTNLKWIKVWLDRLYHENNKNIEIKIAAVITLYFVTIVAAIVIPITRAETNIIQQFISVVLATAAIANTLFAFNSLEAKFNARLVAIITSLSLIAISLITLLINYNLFIASVSIAISIALPVVCCNKNNRLAILYIIVLGCAIALTTFYSTNSKVLEIVAYNNTNTLCNCKSLYSHLLNHVSTTSPNYKISLSTICTILTFSYFSLIFVTLCTIGRRVFLPNISKIAKKLYFTMFMVIILSITFWVSARSVLVLQFKNKTISSYISSINRSVCGEYSSESLSCDQMLKYINIHNWANINIYTIDGDLVSDESCSNDYINIVPRKLNSLLVKDIVEAKGEPVVVYNNTPAAEYVAGYSVLGRDKIILTPYDAHEIENKFYQISVKFGAFILLVFIILLIVLSVIYKRITKPLDLLSNNIKAIRTRGKIEMDDEARNSEVAVIVEQYNMLVNELEKHHKYMIGAERERTWSRMIKMVAHEIKNPLTPMMLKTEMLLRKIDNGDSNWQEEVKPTLNTILSQSMRITHLIKKMAENPQEFIGDAKELNLKEFFSQIEIIFSDFEDVKITINYEYRNNASNNIYIRNELLFTVATNIIHNAIEAMEQEKFKDGVIIVTAIVSSDNLRLKIFNNGPIIDSGDIEKIFAYQYTTKIGGQGIGLYFIDMMLHVIGGTIAVSSSADVGTEFDVVIPLK